LFQEQEHIVAGMPKGGKKGGGGSGGGKKKGGGNKKGSNLSMSPASLSSLASASSLTALAGGPTSSSSGLSASAMAAVVAPPGLTNLGNTCFFNSALQVRKAGKNISSGGGGGGDERSFVPDDGLPLRFLTAWMSADPRRECSYASATSFASRSREARKQETHGASS
jgi:hypothetical protein